MDVVRLHGPCDLRLHNEKVPDPTAGEALVRVTAVGVCGSDLHWFGEAGIGDARLEHPLVLGHEFAGVVESPASPLFSRRVAVDPAIPCLECEFCLAGEPNLCNALRFAGHGDQDGALREYVAWPERCLFPLPDTLSDADGAMLEPLGVALYALDLGRVRPGESVGVFGCGPIGLLIVQLARLAGASDILATDRLPHRLQAAQACGATQTLLVEDGQRKGIFRQAPTGRGLEVVFEAAGENQAVEAAVEAARPGGRVVLVGIPFPDQTAFTASSARRKGLALIFSRRMKFTYPRAIRLVERGLVDVRSLVTHTLPLSQAGQAFDLAQRREGLKMMVRIEK